MGSPDPKPKVVILGAGFAGLAAARSLSDSAAEVVLVDRNVYSTFQPLLYQVATGGLNPGDVAYPVRGFASRHQTGYRHGTVTAVDAERRLVHLRDGDRLPYDYLVVALGADVDYFGVPGAAEHAAALYTRGEAIGLRDALMSRLEGLASARTSSGLSIVVVGGGPTGVEMAGTLAELRSTGIPAAFPEVDPNAIRVVLVEQGRELLAPFAPDLRAYALAELERRGVEVAFGTAIRRVEADSVELQDGSRLAANLTVWAAGVSVPSLIGDWGLPQGRGGRLLVDVDLRVQGQDRVFAVGDVALDPEHPLPQLAQPAIQTGRHAGAQIGRLLEERPSEPFVYRDKGTMATIGRRAAVVEFPNGLELKGTVAWMGWLALHIVTLLGNRNRASALLNLSWRYLAWPNGSGVIVGDLPEADGRR